MCSVLNTFSEYIYVNISKTILHILFSLSLKSPKTFSGSLTILSVIKTGMLCGFAKTLKGRRLSGHKSMGLKFSSI